MISAVGPDVAIYEARYQFTRRTGWAAAGAAAFVAVGLLVPMPVPLTAAVVAFFGVGLLCLLAVALGRRTAFRADASGITLGRPLALPWLPSAAFFPWHDIACLHLSAVRARSRIDMPFVGIEFKPDAAGAPRRYQSRLAAQTLLGGKPGVVQMLQSWRLDVGRLHDTIAAVAPGVGLTSTMSRQAAARIFSGARSPYRPSRAAGALRLFWRFFAPVLFAALLTDGIVHGVPALSAHFGGGRTGTFTVTRVQCSADGSDCTTWGRFVASGGTDVRSRIKMSPDTATPGVGGRQAAVDTGDPEFVFPPGGAPAWWIYSIVIWISGLLLGLWAASTIRVLRRRVRRQPVRTPVLLNSY
jgi:hypothetical protein